MQREDKLKYLKIALTMFGIFHRMNLCNDDVGLAIGMGLDTRTARI